jgi:hypothetical protein
MLLLIRAVIREATGDDGGYQDDLPVVMNGRSWSAQMSKPLGTFRNRKD